MPLPNPSQRATEEKFLVHWDPQNGIELRNQILCRKLLKLGYEVFHNWSIEDPN